MTILILTTRIIRLVLWGRWPVETSKLQQHVNGQDQAGSGATESAEFENEFFGENPSPKRVENLDLEDYRAGQPLKLAEILASPSSRRVEVRKPRRRDF